MLERKIKRHFEEGDDVRTPWFWSYFKLLDLAGFVLMISFHICVEGFSIGDRGVLYKEGSLSWLWAAFCI